MAALGMALLVIFNRKMAGFSDVLALQFWVAMMATPLLVAGAVLGHFSGLQPLRIPMPDPVVVLKCAAVAVTGTTAHWLIYVATEHASAPVVAPMIYVQLILAGVICWTMFGDAVDALSDLRSEEHTSELQSLM